MGFPKCSWCQNLMGPLNDVAKEENIEVIYYLDIKEIRDNTFAKGHKDFEKLSDDVKIVSEVSESSSNTGLIIGIIAVIVVIGAGAFYFYKKKSKSNKDNLE